MGSAARRNLSDTVTSKKKSYKRETNFLETVMSLGLVMGLVSAIGAPAAGNCRATVDKCVGQSIGAVARPYLVHAAVGAGIGLMVAIALIELWRWRNGAQPARAIVPQRQAIPERVRHEVWRRDRGSCVECGSRARLEFDHIIPLSRGGSNTVRNIELRCEPCNRRKGARI